MPGRIADLTPGNSSTVAVCAFSRSREIGWHVVREEDGVVTDVLEGPFGSFQEAYESGKAYQHWGPVYARRWTGTDWSKT